jgi:glycerophosphoryl diester phosphodiesterase
MGDRFRVIAHRGASAYAPENTLPAFERAVALGATEVELDVRFSADDEIIVFHDDRLDTKTDRSGRVRHHDARTLRRTDIGSWFDRTHPDAPESFAGTCVVGLDEVFERLGDQVHYHVEIKGWEDWLPLRLLQSVDRYELRDRVTVTSFSMRPLSKMHALDRSIPICFLLRDAADALRSAEFRPELEGRDLEAIHAYWIEAASASGFRQIGVRARDIGPSTLSRGAANGLEIRAWGVSRVDELPRLVELGVVGATVDWPDRALDRLRGLG